MKVKFMKQIQLEDDNLSIKTLCEIIKLQFNDVVKFKQGRTIYIGRNKYISLDYTSKKESSCYIDLGNTYLRYNRTLKDLFYIVNNDPYIKRNFKY